MSCGCLVPDVLGHQDGCSILREAVDAEPLGFRPLAEGPISFDPDGTERWHVGPPPFPGASDLTDPMEHRQQGPCPCCGSHVGPTGEAGEGGCYAPGDLPANWPDVEPWASQRCTWRTDVRDPSTQCRCWGGSDYECEDCWISSK